MTDFSLLTFPFRARAIFRSRIGVLFGNMNAILSERDLFYIVCNLGKMWLSAVAAAAVVAAVARTPRLKGPENHINWYGSCILFFFASIAFSLQFR